VLQFWKDFSQFLCSKSCLDAEYLDGMFGISYIKKVGRNLPLHAWLRPKINLFLKFWCLSVQNWCSRDFLKSWVHFYTIVSIVSQSKAWFPYDRNGRKNRVTNFSTASLFILVNHIYKSFSSYNHPHIFSSEMLYFGWWERSWLNLYDRYDHMETRHKCIDSCNVCMFNGIKWDQLYNIQVFS
jgi:hypothetical protein